MQSQDLSDEDQQRLANLGKNGPRDVAGLTMTHSVPNEHVVVERQRSPDSPGDPSATAVDSGRRRSP